jgi:PKD repeat protein
MKKFAFTLLVFVGLAACKKDSEPAPTVDFVAVEDNYGGVQFTTTSLNATTFNWKFSDGTTETGPSPFHVFPRNGFFTVNLEVTGPGGTTTLTRDVAVTGVRGKASFWKSSGSRSLELYVDDTYVGVVIVNYPKGVTTCDAAGTALASGLKEGEHKYYAKEQGVFPAAYQGTFSVVGGECKPIKIR